MWFLVVLAVGWTCRADTAKLFVIGLRKSYRAQHVHSRVQLDRAGDVEALTLVAHGWQDFAGGEKCTHLPFRGLRWRVYKA